MHAQGQGAAFNRGKRNTRVAVARVATPGVMISHPRQEPRPEPMRGRGVGTNYWGPGHGGGLV